MNEILKSIYHISKMDCPSEENMIRMKLDGLQTIKKLDFDIENRNFTVYHSEEDKRMEEEKDEKLAYLMMTRDIKGKDPTLFKQIKNMPLRARVDRKSTGLKKGTICFIKDAMMNLPFTNDEETQLIIIAKDAIRPGKFQNLQRDINKLKKAVTKSPLKPVIILERIIHILKSYPLKTEEDIEEHSAVRPVIPKVLNPEIIITESYSK